MADAVTAVGAVMGCEKVLVQLAAEVGFGRTRTAYVPAANPVIVTGEVVVVNQFAPLLVEYWNPVVASKF